VTVTAAPAAPPPPATLSRPRRALIWALILLASLIGIGSILSTWVERQMLDNGSWTDASAELIEDPEVRGALSVFLVDALYDNVDVSAGLEQRLPPDLEGLAPTLAGALRQPATEAVERLLEAPRIQNLWIEASSAAQQKLVNVLEDKTGFGISTGQGVVTVDLSELLSEVGRELGVPASVLAKLPSDAGVFTVMSSSRLEAAQAGVKTVEVLSVWLLVVVLGLFALAVYLARGERRETLRTVGWAFIVVGLVALVVRRLAGNQVVDALASPSAEDAGHRTWLIGTEILGQIGWAAIFYGVVVVLGAVLAGPSSAAKTARGWIAPVLNGRPGLAFAAVGSAFLLLVLWGPTHALRTAWGILLLGALLVAGVVVLRRQTLHEFPQAGADEPPGSVAAGPA
jgi:hypothetical protein